MKWLGLIFGIVGTVFGVFMSGVQIVLLVGGCAEYVNPFRLLLSLFLSGLGVYLLDCVRDYWRGK